MKLFGSVKELFSLVFRDASSNKQLTIEPNQATTYTADRTIQAPPQDANSIMVSEDATQALTNKTISGASNTISNINLASQVTGVLPTANGGTGQNSTATFPTSGVVVTEAASENLTNKNLASSTNTLTGATAGSFTNTGTISLPTTTDTLIGRVSTDQGANRVKNKDLEASSTRVVDSTDTSKKIAFDSSGSTTGKTLTIASSNTLDRTWTIPDATDTAVGRNTTDSLTNKKFTDAVVIEDPGAGTNKITIQAPTLSGDYTLTLPTNDGNSNQVLQTNGSGVLAWADVAASGGSKNYLSSIITSNGTNNGNGDFELGTTTGWSLAHSSLTSAFPSTVGTAGNSFSSAGGAHGGSAASGNLSISATSSSPLAKTYSLSYASSAATTAGDMVISDAFNIDTEDQAKVLTFRAYYKATSNPSNGNFSGTSSNSFGWAIYDVTNAAWIMPAGVWNIVQSSGVGYSTGTFQATSNSTQYQIAWFNANASAGAITMYLDDISVGPNTSSVGPAMSDWVVNTGFTENSFGTTSNVHIFTRSVGDTMYVRGYFQAGTVAAAVSSLTLPVSIDSNKLDGSANLQKLGTFAAFQATTTLYPSASNVVGDIFFDGTDLTHIYFSNSETTSGYVKTNANGLMNNSDFITFEFSFPVAGKSSNTTMSSDTDTRVVELLATGQPADITTGNPIIYPTVTKDTHGSYNASTGIYTVPVTGFYNVACSGSAGTLPATAGFFIYKNNTLTTLIGAAPIANNKFWGSGEIYCVAGDTLHVSTDNTVSGFSASTGFNNLAITRRSGPAVVAASESVNARYHFSGTQSITSGSSTQTLTPTAKDFDSHSAFNTSTGIYTVPVSGKYQIISNIRYNAYSASDTPGLRVYKNGSLVASNYTIAFATSNAWAVHISDLESCNAGDTLELRAFQASGSPQTIGTDADANYVAFSRAGN